MSLLLARRKAPSLSAKETELLQAINRGVPAEIQQRYDSLRTKLRSETITSEEHEELLILVETIEQADAERLESLIVLSQLRQISLPDLIKQLGFSRRRFMPKAYISSEQKRQIIQRADRHCEYCKCSMDYASNSFEMEHVFPLAADGDSSLDNLALACGGCNNHKHTKVDALDPVSQVRTLLFHPRRQALARAL